MPDFRSHRFEHEEPVFNERDVSRKPPDAETPQSGSFLTRIMKSPIKRLVAGVVAGAMGLFTPFAERSYHSVDTTVGQSEPGHFEPGRVEKDPGEVIFRYAEPVTVESTEQISRPWSPKYEQMAIPWVEIFSEHFNESLSSAIESFRVNTAAQYEIPLENVDEYLGSARILIEADASVEGDADRNQTLSQEMADATREAVEQGQIQTLGMPLVIEAIGVGEKTILFRPDGSVERELDETQTVKEVSLRLDMVHSDFDVTDPAGRLAFERAGNRSHLSPEEQVIFDQYYTNARGVHFSITLEPIPMTVVLPPEIVREPGIVSFPAIKIEGSKIPPFSEGHDIKTEEFARLWKDDEEEEKKEPGKDTIPEPDSSGIPPKNPVEERSTPIPADEDTPPVPPTEKKYRKIPKFSSFLEKIGTGFIDIGLVPSIPIIALEPDGRWTSTPAKLPEGAIQRVPVEVVLPPLPVDHEPEGKKYQETPFDPEQLKRGKKRPVPEVEKPEPVERPPQIFTPDVIGFITDLTHRDPQYHELTNQVIKDPGYPIRRTEAEPMVLVDDIYRFIDDADTKRLGLDYSACISEVRIVDAQRGMDDAQKIEAIAHVLLTKWKEHDILSRAECRTEFLASLDYHKNTEQIFWAYAHAEELLRLSRENKGVVTKATLESDWKIQKLLKKPRPVELPKKVVERAEPKQRAPRARVEPVMVEPRRDGKAEVLARQYKEYERIARLRANLEDIRDLRFANAVARVDWYSGCTDGLRPVNMEKVKKQLAKSKGFFESYDSFLQRQDQLELLEKYDSEVIAYEKSA